VLLSTVDLYYPGSADYDQDQRALVATVTKDDLDAPPRSSTTAWFEITETYTPNFEESLRNIYQFTKDCGSCFNVMERKLCPGESEFLLDIEIEAKAENYGKLVKDAVGLVTLKKVVAIPCKYLIKFSS